MGEENERLFRGYSGRLLIACSFGWVGLSIGRFVIPPLLPTIITDLDITRFQAGIAMTVLWGLYALSQYPSGRFSDHLSRKTFLVSGVALFAAGFALLLGTVNYGIFVFGMATIGTGAGMFSTPTKALISDLFTARRGQAFGVQTAASDFGGALAGGLAVVVVAATTWHAAFLPVVVILVITLLMLHFWSRESYSVAWVSLNLRETGRRLTTDTRTRNLIAAYSLFSFTWQGTLSFLPAFLQTVKSFSLEFASTVFAMVFIVGIVAKPIAGIFGDRVPRILITACALLVAIAGLSGLILLQSPLQIVIAILIFAIGFMAFPPVAQAYLMDMFPDASAGGDMGATRTIYLGVGSLGSAYVGFVAEWAGFTTAFVGLAVCLFLSSILVLIIAKSSQIDYLVENK